MLMTIGFRSTQPHFCVNSLARGRFHQVRPGRTWNARSSSPPALDPGRFSISRPVIILGKGVDERQVYQLDWRERDRMIVKAENSSSKDTQR
ncbi:uncharacterized protein LY89DRAFT_275613 [Mollisia scopiformis]|uniref:Uncharacterized protein n=1 Tax=Mollisia scopiformis TaxID=149040 RepID=A0A132BB95_MOLSC|nr:uncharacterized protein LY89DRAFT_275613 [Mollisia scopiformis]KUJ09685.1 hypothetical protein LY89DRAFT_275613 [Mollisia scopiformis]